MGLEHDRDNHFALDRGHGIPSVHLPSMSLGALLQLRSSLDRPGAVALDVEPDSEAQGGFYSSLLVQVEDALPEAAYKELEELLEKRGEDTDAVVLTPPEARWPHREFSLEAMMAHENGAEALDISICPLSSCSAGLKPLVALARFPKNSKVRYAALIVCSAATGQQGESLPLACEVGRALATAFMNEPFVAEVRRNTQPDAIVASFDHYLSTMTMVPTVHIGGNLLEGSERATLPGGIDLDGSDADCLLADSLVNSMERRICNIMEIPPPPPPGTGHGGSSSPKEKQKEIWKPFFVEVDRLISQSKDWRVTRCLRQGLELDISSGDTKPHLPHVSLAGLKHVRELIGPKSVALDVVATCAKTAVEAVVGQLVYAGLPASAAADINEALLNRVVCGAQARPATKDQPLVMLKQAAALRQNLRNGELSSCNELVNPSGDDETCLILSIAGQIPPHHQIIGAFVRLKSPIDFIINASKAAPARFLLVLVGPARSEDELILVTDSLAALAVDEALMGHLAAAGDAEAFTAAVEARLGELIFMPQGHVQGGAGAGMCPRTKSTMSLEPKRAKSTMSLEAKRAKSTMSLVPPKEPHKDPGEKKKLQPPVTPEAKECWGAFVKRLQKYSLPLITGVLLALLWTNIDEESYHTVTHENLLPGVTVFSYDVSMHFLVNDIFMCLFFGLAIKEVTEALLPGGSLSPLRRAANPLFATLGGIVGPVVVYLLTVTLLGSAGVFDDLTCENTPGGSGHRRLGGAAAAADPGGSSVGACPLANLLKGWGVPTATDISLAWMFALLIFGAGHPAINFLLLLAIVDDAIGMVIIAVFYGNPEKPLDPKWFSLVALAMLLAYGLRRLKVNFWSVYVCLCGPISWLGLILAHVHPALALVFVVPFMPAVHARMQKTLSEKHLGQASLSPIGENARVHAVVGAMPDRLKRQGSVLELAAHLLAAIEEAPLHTFEHHAKLPVDLGMFFFGLANAGVKMGSVGGVTLAVTLAFYVGKTLGIAGFGVLAVYCGFDLPAGITLTDLFTMSALGGVGLTVALFVANTAFTDPGLRGQAKMGAVISVGSAGLAKLIKSLGDRWSRRRSEGSASPVTDVEDDDDAASASGGGDGGGEGDSESDFDEEEDMDTVVLDQVMRVMSMERQYKRHGTLMPLAPVTRAVSKEITSFNNLRTPTKDSAGGSTFGERRSNRSSTLPGGFMPDRRKSNISCGSFTPGGSADGSLRREAARVSDVSEEDVLRLSGSKLLTPPAPAKLLTPPSYSVHPAGSARTSTGSARNTGLRLQPDPSPQPPLIQ